MRSSLEPLNRKERPTRIRFAKRHEIGFQKASPVNPPRGMPGTAFPTVNLLLLQASLAVADRSVRT